MRECEGRSLTSVVSVLLGGVIFTIWRIFLPPAERADAAFAGTIGKEVPEVPLVELFDGQSLSSRTHTGEQHILFFAAAGCSACEPVYDAVREVASRLPVVTVFSGPPLREARAKAKREASPGAVHDAEGVLGDALGVKYLPAVLLVDESGVVRHGAVGDVSAPALVKRVLRELRAMEQ